MPHKIWLLWDCNDLIDIFSTEEVANKYREKYIEEKEIEPKFHRQIEIICKEIGDAS